jgi:hypothetical protein
MVGIGLELVVVGESGALNSDECYVQEDHRRNDIRIVKPGVWVDSHGGINIQAFGMRMMSLIAHIVL